MDGFFIKQGGRDDLDLVRHLWEKLCSLHCDLSVHFKDVFQNADWDKRKSRLINGAKDIFLNYIVEEESQKIVGYCISLVEKEDDSVGEIASIYVDKDCRGAGLGSELITRALQWLQTQGTKTQKLLVGAGNEKVLDFYKRFNFVPRSIELQQIEKKAAG